MKEDDWGIEDDWDADEEANDDQAAEGKSQKIPENQFDCAEQGFLPWIDDPDNQDNRNDNVGIRRIVIDERIFECFQQTFSYEGRKHPETRPHPAKWFRAFLQAEKRTVDCPCGWSYYYETGNCPCCGKPLSPLFLAVTYELHTDAEGEDFRTECSRRVISFGKTTELCASDLLPLPTAKLIERDTVYFELADSKKQNDRWMITQKAELICELTESGKSYDGSLTLKLQLQTLDTLRIRLTVGNRVRVVEFQMYQP